MLPRPRSGIGPVSGGGRRSEERSRQRGFRRADQDAGRGRYLRLLQHSEHLQGRAPLRRNVDTVEVAEAAAFLLSDAGKGVTGEVLLVDAGFHVTGM